MEIVEAEAKHNQQSTSKAMAAKRMAKVLRRPLVYNGDVVAAIAMQQVMAMRRLNGNGDCCSCGGCGGSKGIGRGRWLR
jgi:hypothetical protein